MKKIIQYVIDEKLSQGHAKILVGLENAQLLAEKIISKKLSKNWSIDRLSETEKSVLRLATYELLFY